MRFVVVLDPADQWLVLDRSTNLPAEVGDKVLIGLSHSEAERLAREANAQSRWPPSFASPQCCRLGGQGYRR